MVTLHVSKNILKRLMNIYIHQAVGNYTGSRYTSLLPFMLARLFNVRRLSIFVHRYGDAYKRKTRAQKRRNNSVPSRRRERIPAADNPTGYLRTILHTC